MSVFSRVARTPMVRLMRNTVNDLIDGGYQKSFAQEGEDLILMRYFERKRDGFYVDVGAHDPRRFSNTLLLYRQGWRGINIDATPGSMGRFRMLRPRDVSIECAVAEQAGEATLHLFDEPALNTLDERLAGHHAAAGYRIVARRPMPVCTLSQILERYLPALQPIDLLSVDVEGFDLQVLRSNDWQRYRPSVIVVESLKADDAATPDTAAFLEALGYRRFAQTVNSHFFEAPLRR